MLVLFSTACLYCACFGFFQASPKRTAFQNVKIRPVLQKAIFYGSWALTIISLYGFSYVSGLERGIPIWLGVFTMMGALSLIISALWPQTHKATGYMAITTSVLSGLFAVFGAQT